MTPQGNDNAGCGRVHRQVLDARRAWSRFSLDASLVWSEKGLSGLPLKDATVRDAGSGRLQSGTCVDSGHGRSGVGFTEYLLLAVVVVVPLVIAAAVTLWSLKQVQYRPRKRRPPSSVNLERSASEADGAVSPADSTKS